jgi:hypothetical protein
MPLSRFSFLLFLAILLGVLAPRDARGQTSPFRAGLLLGMNAAQIDGDELRGFDKAGLNLGARFAMVFTPRTELSMDLLYSQRGAQAPPSRDNSTLLNKYSLHYLEVPFIFHYKDWAAVTTDETTFYRLEVTGGLAYSRLIRARMQGNPFEGRQDLLNQNDFSYILGFGFHVNPVHSFHFRYTDSINFLFDDLEVLNVRRLRGYFLTLQYLYLF